MASQVYIWYIINRCTQVVGLILNSALLLKCLLVRFWNSLGTRTLSRCRLKTRGHLLEWIRQVAPPFADSGRRRFAFLALCCFLSSSIFVLAWFWFSGCRQFVFWQVALHQFNVVAHPDQRWLNHVLQNVIKRMVSRLQFPLDWAVHVFVVYLYFHFGFCVMFKALLPLPMRLLAAWFHSASRDLAVPNFVCLSGCIPFADNLSTATAALCFVALLVCLAAFVLRIQLLCPTRLTSCSAA